MGKAIHLDGKNKSKLFIIENEFKRAEKKERDRQKEEKDLRNRIQKEKFNKLEQAMRIERVKRIKEGQIIQKEIVQTTREALLCSSSYISNENEKSSSLMHTTTKH